jgi:hypothetical protein
MHACCLLMCMSLNFFLLCILNNEKCIGKRKNSKGGLEGSVPRSVGGWVCYSLVSELLVETSGRYGPGLLVRVSGSSSNSDRGVEKIRRNGVS